MMLYYNLDWVDISFDTIHRDIIIPSVIQLRDSCDCEDHKAMDVCKNQFRGIQLAIQQSDQQVDKGKKKRMVIYDYSNKHRAEAHYTKKLHWRSKENTRLAATADEKVNRCKHHYREEMLELQMQGT